MKTINYKLKSIPEYKGIPVPEETALQAQKFLDFILGTKQPASLAHGIIEYEYFVRPSIVENALHIVNLRDSCEVEEITKLSWQDKVYLETCLYIHKYNGDLNLKERPEFLNKIFDALKEVCEI